MFAKQYFIIGKGGIEHKIPQDMYMGGTQMVNITDNHDRLIKFQMQTITCVINLLQRLAFLDSKTKLYNKSYRNVVRSSYAFMFVIEMRITQKIQE